MGNKTFLRGVLVFATIALLAGLQIAGASPKTPASKHTQKITKKEVPQARLVLSDGTLTADKLAYKYQEGALLSVHAYGHVKLEVPKYNITEINGVASFYGGETTKYSFIAISREALFTPSYPPVIPNSLLQLVGSPSAKAGCRIAGKVTMGDDAQFRYGERIGKYILHSGWVNVGWFTYEPGDGPISDAISYPTNREKIFTPWPNQN